MKMIVAIVDNNKAEQVSKALIDSEYRVTRLASTGGIFREGETTLMVGVENDQVEVALEIIRENFPSDTDELQATLYVLNVRDFQRV